MIYWNSFGDFLTMCGPDGRCYALYVWGSFGVTALVMAFEPVFLVRRRKNTIARLQRQLRADERAAANRS
jgi:heme exporter protein D